MIEVKIETRKEDKDLLVDVSAVAYNAGAPAVAASIVENTKGLSCHNHPGTPSVLWIRPSRTAGRIFDFDKSGFCCSQFAEKVMIREEKAK